MGDVKKGRPVKYVIDFDTSALTMKEVAAKLGCCTLTALKLLKGKEFRRLRAKNSTKVTAVPIGDLSTAPIEPPVIPI